MNKIFNISVNLKSKVYHLNLSPIRLDNGCFILVSAIAKALVGLYHFLYKSAGAEHPYVSNGTSTVFRVAVCSYL